MLAPSSFHIFYSIDGNDVIGPISLAKSTSERKEAHDMRYAAEIDLEIENDDRAPNIVEHTLSLR